MFSGKNSPWNKGLTKKSDVRVRKLAELKIGKPRTKETIDKIKLQHKGKHYGIKTEWKKGHSPWNKGIKYTKDFVLEHRIGLNPNSHMKKKIQFVKSLEIKLCECGCGKEIIFKEYHRKHPVKFISGHNSIRKYPKEITQELIENNQTICVCGCGKMISFKLFHLRRKPKYLPGHNGKFLVHTLEARKKIGDSERGKPGRALGSKRTEEFKKKQCEKMKLSHKLYPEKWTNSYHNGFEKLWKDEEKSKKLLNIIQSKEHVKKCLGRRQKTSLEIKFEEIINKNNLPYKFVGNGQFFIERKNPDFINVNGEKIAIEVYCRKHKGIVSSKDKFNIGYDENKLNEYKNKRQEIFNKYGWKVIFFDETEIKEDNVLKILGGIKNEN